MFQINLHPSSGKLGWQSLQSDWFDEMQDQQKTESKVTIDIKRMSDNG